MLTLVIDCFLCSILLAEQEDADYDDADDDVDDVDKKPPMKKSKWGSTVTPPQNSRASFTTNLAFFTGDTSLHHVSVDQQCPAGYADIHHSANFRSGHFKRH
jgi:hypothetical protein